MLFYSTMRIIDYLCSVILIFNFMKLRILEICKQKGMTQKSLSSIIGLSAVGLSKAINGNPTKDTLEKIAAALNVPIIDLFQAPASGNIVCPKCGNSIELTVKSLSNV